MKLAKSATLRGNAVVDRPSGGPWAWISMVMLESRKAGGRGESVHGVGVERGAAGLVVKDLDDLQRQAEPRAERQRDRTRRVKRLEPGLPSAADGITIVDERAVEHVSRVHRGAENRHHVPMSAADDDVESDEQRVGLHLRHKSEQQARGGTHRGE